jgi:hypothetical protein
MRVRVMSRRPATIPGNPALKPAEDYYRLRREGIGFIEQLGSRLWTDYNPHDPGITILEALCYAVTDLTYRTGWDIRDILAPRTPSADPSLPFPGQPFFTARDILTVNPTTPDDFRRLLIDLDTVRNAWVFCKECACDLNYYAWCDKEQLMLSHQAPGTISPAPRTVTPLGLYDVLLELESDPRLGDLNDRKIEYTSTCHDDQGAHPIIMELRFPDLDLISRAQMELILESDDAFAGRNGSDFELRLTRFGATKSYDLFSDTGLDEDGRDSYLRDHWRTIFYLSFEIELIPSGKKIVIENASLRLFSDVAAKNTTTALDLKALLEEKGAGGFIRRWRDKEKAKLAAVKAGKAALHGHRNLDEDYCRVRVVDVEEVAACADVEVKPDADIELVQAKIWFEIERYFNPPVPFYGLQELLDSGTATEDIFNGPMLDNGFIRADDLEAASLKGVLRVSDIINRLMEIQGVVAVNRMQLTKYDAEGNMVRGAADPAWSSEGKPVFDPDRTSASWLMYIGRQHQPRLYLNASRFLFFKNGLSFLPAMDEARDTLTQLRGEAERPKVTNGVNDLPVPAGTFRQPEDYFPLQYGFPPLYGIGPDGLPATASEERRAQAKQLKAYLMVFEQLLGNAFAQVAHAAELFSLEPGVERTYFVREFSEAVIYGYDEIVSGLDKASLEAMTETLPEFLQRRNRFLDHIMARFGEQFGEYALLLTNLQGQQAALDRLIADKIAFLKDYPLISRDRARGFNYRKDPCSPENGPVLKKRIGLLLGWSGQKRTIIVEHLLLRPKFPGDALYPACSDGACRTCGEEDPYSFRLTFVMPGWLGPFDSNMEMRDFADRTIRQETPSHLLAKICWVGNDGFARNLRAPVIDDLARLLETDGRTVKGARLSQTVACKYALAIYKAFSKVFERWYRNRTLYYLHPSAVESALVAEFGDHVGPTAISRTIRLDDPLLWAGIQALMVQYFLRITLCGRQFERFEHAWFQWLEANAVFDWTEERLQERVEAILADNLVSGAGSATLGKDALRGCAATILSHYGTHFHDWLEANFKAGHPIDGFTVFKHPPVLLCPGLTYKPRTAAKVRALLKDRYNHYQEVSKRLWIVVHLLSRLNNTYPPATLHDWADGSDTNPVRLGKTALGNW